MNIEVNSKDLSIKEDLFLKRYLWLDGEAVDDVFSIILLLITVITSSDIMTLFYNDSAPYREM